MSAIKHLIGDAIDKVEEVTAKITSSSSSSSDATISGIAGAQNAPGTKKYDEYKYIYATSTYGQERDLNPALLVRPKNKDDIIQTLKYAKEKGVAVAIKTGGHQYSGACSTSAPNILLDLEHTFRGHNDRTMFREEGKVRCSVSWSLGEFHAWLTENKVFVPHGQCTEVHMGGHVQTGGYGQLARSFGLLGDHVLSFELIDSDGISKEVTKDSNPDLFGALLGGSPGNLGVITHFTLKVHRDEDYAGSRGMRTLFFYKPEDLRRLLGMLVEMAEDENWPRNYDFTVSCLSSSFPLLDLWPGLDSVMARFHPDLYGKNGQIGWPRTILVYAQWVPFEKGDKCDLSWFDRIKEGSDVILGDNHLQEKPMSELCGDWLFRNVREFEKPYVKRTYCTNSTTLSKDGWADWATKRIDSIVTPEHNRCWLSAQLQVMGGKHSMFRRNAGNGTFSWRDTTICYTMDCFHDPETKARAEDWQKVNDEESIGPNGIFSKKDRRLMWGSYGDWDLDKMWDRYFDDRATYDKLRRIRKEADPDGIFTANPFCVKRAD
ncbi:hypothetical protein GGS20DRAFT_530424 [Poronia punctata]|nr:hypothetical protein GGS20DRAFT_530424 [Poronia punctata]